MERGESLLAEMRRAYRDELGPPVDASARVLRSVIPADRRATPATRRTPIVVWITVPLFAAAALTLMWCVPGGAIELAADRRGDEAVYRGEDRAPSEAVTRAIDPLPAIAPATLPATSIEPTAAAAPAVEVPTRRRTDVDRSSTPERPSAAVEVPAIVDAPREPASSVEVVDGPRIETLAVALQGVERNLRADRPDLALATLARLRDELEVADLGEEHDALRLLALCSSRPADETDAVRARFAAAFPGSLYAGRIAQTCGVSEKFSGGPR